VIVLDASAAVELLVGTRLGERVAARIGDPATSLHAPHLVDLEVAQTLRRYLASGTLEPDRARRALEALGQLDLTRYPHDALLPRIWALRANLTAYDAAYVALAEALGGSLLTCDSKLARAAEAAATARIETVSGK